MSPISSRNSVPPCACSKRPVRRVTAPVNAPFSCLRGSLSSRARDRRAFDATTVRRLGYALRERRATLFPCAASPESAPYGLSATRVPLFMTASIAGLSPMIVVPGGLGAGAGPVFGRSCCGETLITIGSPSRSVASRCVVPGRGPVRATGVPSRCARFNRLGDRDLVDVIALPRTGSRTRVVLDDKSLALIWASRHAGGRLVQRLCRPSRCRTPHHACRRAGHPARGAGRGRRPLPARACP